MIEGIKSALAFPHDPDRLRFVCFLTDGFIGNESDILREVDRHLGESRVFSFGAGSAPNRYLLDSMAKLGKGTAAYVGLRDDAAKVMDDFFDRIAHPALTNLKVDWDGMRESDIYPRRTPDLFVGGPVVLTGRFSGHGRQTIHIHGKVGRDRVDLDLPVNLDSQPIGNDAFPTLWARQKIADLYDQHAWTSNPFLKRDVRQTALEFNLVSAFTSFVAVDAAERTAGRYGTTVPVAVPVPEGTKYDTTVGQ
jgi:Ca-activated chloride channel family protein